MFPSEMVILMAMSASCSSLNSLTHWTDTEGEYIGYLRDSLVKRDYLRKGRFNKYQLSPMGKDALSAFLRKNKIVEEDIVNRLRRLGIDIEGKQEQTIDKLKKEMVEVK